MRTWILSTLTVVAVVAVINPVWLLYWMIFAGALSAVCLVVLGIVLVLRHDDEDDRARRARMDERRSRSDIYGGTGGWRAP